MEDGKLYKHSIQPDDPQIIHSYANLKAWIEDSLDIFRAELTQLLYPLFLHIYFELIAQQRNAKEFFELFKDEFPQYKIELMQISSITDNLHLSENAIASRYRKNKYHIRIGKYAFDLFKSYLEENNLTQILKIVSHYFTIKIYVGAKKEESEGLTGADQGNDEPVNLHTHLISKECEEAILNDEKYKYDHLESFVHSLKKQRDQNKPSFYPNATYILAEIEKLKDLCKKVNLNKNNLPSICCYTIHNTYENLCSAEFSDDLKYIALGYQDSYIEIHSLAEPLKRLKSSVELGKSEEDDLYEEIGNTCKLIGHSGPVYSMKFFLGNKSLLSCSQDRTVRLWSLDLFTCVAVYKCHVFPIWTIDVSPDNFYFASGGADRSACVWSLIGSKPERLFASALSDVTAVKFHPNGNYLFCGSTDQKIRMHCMQDGALLRIFNGHTDGITCLAVSHCGKYLLSGGKDKNVILWDINSGKSIIKFVGHENVVYSVSFCYYGSVIVSSSADNTVRLWDRSEPQGMCLGVYRTKNTPIISVKFGYRNIVSAVGPYSV